MNKTDHQAKTPVELIKDPFDRWYCYFPSLAKPDFAC